jgi:hypothetical protein
VILPDVNILIYAFREDAPFHEVCRPWLEAVIDSGVDFGISRLALAAVIRVTTGPRFYVQPSTLNEALEFCRYLMDRPNCRPVEPGSRHWVIFQRLILDTNTRGRRVTDAWFAALAIESGSEWITMDRDFARFPGLRWRLPETPPTST